jgi:hypothetical protein
MKSFKNENEVFHRQDGVREDAMNEIKNMQQEIGK